MKILQIGAGSMGTRRLRDLLKLGTVEVSLFEERDDRRKLAAERFGIQTFDSLHAALQWKPDTLCISTPPQTHRELVELALEHGLHHFCEANIWTPDYRRVETVAKKKALVAAPSSSLHFLPLVRELRRMTREHLGTLHSYQFCLSTYLPTWHPGEGQEYYARNRSTAAAREMVPFELAYVNHIFEPATHVSGKLTRRGTLEGVHEDLWALQMNLENGAVGQLIVMMGSEQLCRKGSCAGAKGIIEFDLVEGRIRRHSPNLPCVETVECGRLLDVVENVYAEEISTFVDTINGKAKWPYSYRDSAIATATLAACEKSSLYRKEIPVDPVVQPGVVPDDYPPKHPLKFNGPWDIRQQSTLIHNPSKLPTSASENTALNPQVRQQN